MKESDSRILGELHTDMQWVKKTLSNHLRHHEKYEIALIIGVLLMLIDKLVN